MSRFSQLFRHFVSFLAIFFLLIALVLACARSLTPLLTKHKYWLSEGASHALGLPVEMDSVEVSFVGVTPGLSLTRFVVLSPDRKTPILKIQNAKVGINILESLWHRKLITSLIYIDGTEINLEKNGNEIRINGYLLDTAQNNKVNQEGWLAPKFINILNELLSQEKIKLSHFSFKAYQGNEKKIDISDLEFTLHNKNNMHHFRSISNGDLFGGELIVDADFKGNASRREELSGHVYLAFNNSFLSAILGFLPPSSLNIASIKGKTALWLEFKNGILHAAQTQLAIKDLDATMGAQHIQIPLVTGNLFWRQLGKAGWSLSSDQLSYQLDQTLFPISNFSIINNEDNLSQSLVWQNINMQMLQQWVAMKWMPADGLGFFASIRLQGDIKQLKILHQGDWRSLLEDVNTPIVKTSQKKTRQAPKLEWQKWLRSFYLHAQFADFGFQNTVQHISVEHVNAEVILRPESGELKLLTSNANLHFPHLFLNPFSAIKAMGAIRWNKDPAGALSVSTHQFLLENNYSKFESSLDLQFPANQSGATINLLATFEQMDAREIKNLLPRKVMDSALVSWLDQAFLGGEKEDGIVLMRGKLEDFPYAKQQGQFIADVKIKNMNLQYAEGWPPLQQLNASVRFDMMGIFFKMNSGMIVNKPFEKIEAVIPRVFFKKIPSVLTVDSAIEMDIPEALALTQNSPLKKNLPGLSQLEGKGKTQLNLGLRIPLEEKTFDNIKVAGKLNFVESTIVLPGWQLIINEVKGLLYFSEEAVWAENMQAILFEEPATIKIQTIKNAADTITRFIVESTIGIPALKKQFNVPFFNRMQGKTAYRGVLDLPKKEVENLIVTSDLQGIKVNFPSPYGKEVDTSLPFQLRAVFPKEGTYLSFEYANYLQAHLLFSGLDKEEGDFKRGVFHLGNKDLDAANLILPKDEGILVTGKLPELNWDIWQPILKQYFFNSNQNTTAVPFFLIDLNVDKLIALKQVIDQVQLKLESIDKLGGLQLEINSPKVDGNLKIPAAFPKEAITGNFSRLYLPAMKQDTTANSSTSLNIKPKDVPAMNLSIADLQLGTVKLGKIILNLLPDSVGQLLKISVKVDSPLINSQIEGRWYLKNKVEHTHINAQNYVFDLGDLLKNLDLTDKVVGGRGKINWEVSWPASPLNFNLKKLMGSANINLNNGAIVGFDDVTKAKLGLGKLLNVFSLQNVTSGFSDIRHGGYGFTSWSGEYELSAGQITIKNTSLDGTVGKIHANGLINTDQRTYDLVLKITPQYTSSAPVLLGFLAGPIFGVAALAANQVLSFGLNQVTGQSYAVTGAWDDPHVVKLVSGK